MYLVVDEKSTFHDDNFKQASAAQDGTLVNDEFWRTVDNGRLDDPMEMFARNVPSRTCLGCIHHTLCYE